MGEAKFKIIGGNKLFGSLINQTSKNATLPILTASLLCDECVKIVDVPKITDVDNMVEILTKIGVVVKKEGHDLVLDSRNVNEPFIDCELSKTMRSSIFLLGPMLAKLGEVEITFPGGCKIGARPIDLHIKAFKKMGVEVVEREDYLYFKVEKFKNRRLKLKIPSVGATENIIQFACKQKGKTVIINPAKEPEVVDLCNFLNQMGAKILGAGTNKITIYGVDKLLTTTYKPIGDRIVAGTIACAVAICGGDVTISNAVPYQNLKLIKILQQIGCQIDYKNDIMHISSDKNLHSYGNITTGYYPNFPTDLQSLILTVSSVCDGKTTIKEKVYENRFLTVSELKKMGAKIDKESVRKVNIEGVKHLNAANLIAKDLRGGAGLVLAGLAAMGETTIENIHFIDRGYEYLEKQLSEIGANIIRI